MNDTILKVIKNNIQFLENLKKKHENLLYTYCSSAAYKTDPDSEVKALVKNNIYQLAKLLKEMK